MANDQNRTLGESPSMLLHSHSSSKMMRKFSAIENSGNRNQNCDKDPSDGNINANNIRRMERRFSDAASEYVKQKSFESSVIKRGTHETIPRLELEEIDLGDLLGSGGFCNVREVRRLSDSSSISLDIKKKGTEKLAGNSTSFSGPLYSKTRVTPSQKEKSGYVIKYIRSEVREDPDLYHSAVQDLALEAEFLGNLNHPNIIKLHGMSASGFIGFDNNEDAGYFFILEELAESLDTKRSKWVKIEKKYSSFKSKIIGGRGKERKQFFVDRLKVALDLTAPLKYLHDHGVIFRDLKPQNIGFDLQGNLKLFDFGLAREVNSEKRSVDGTYQLTGDTGSRRYMAPEVAMMKPYNELADVYSFAVILWEICSLERAYKGMDQFQHYHQVYCHSFRPSLSSSWPKSIVNLIKNSWSHHFSSRPNMSDIQSVLKQSYTKVCDGNAKKWRASAA